METWSAHHLYSDARKQLGVNAAASLRDYASILHARRLPAIFTLGHLARITGVSFRMLKESVARRREAANYRMYAVKKRAGGRRFIHSVTHDLLNVQKFINEEILQNVSPHHNSFAFHPSGGIRQCAEMHCGARWLFQ